MPPLRGQSNAEKGPVRNIMLGRNGTMGENDKKQDPRRTTTTTRQRSQRRKTRTTYPNSSQERHVGPTGTNNLGHHTTPTAKPRQDMGRAERRQVQASKRVPGSLKHPGPDKGVRAEQWPGPNTSTGASATSNTSKLGRAKICRANYVAR